MAAEINCEGVASEQRRCPLLTDGVDKVADERVEALY